MGHDINVRSSRRKRFWVYASVFVLSVAGVVAADFGLNAAARRLAQHDLTLHTITEDFNNIRSPAMVLAEAIEDYPGGEVEVAELKQFHEAVLVEIAVASEDVEVLVAPEAMQVLHLLMAELGGVDRLIDSIERGSAPDGREIDTVADDLLKAVAGMTDGTALVILREGFEDHFSSSLRIPLLTLPLVALLALIAMGHEMNRGMTLAHDETRSRLRKEDRKRARAERLSSGQARAMELIASGASSEMVEASLVDLVTVETDGSWMLVDGALESVDEVSEGISPGLESAVERVLELLSERDRFTSELVHEATHDGLTMLRNRAAFVAEVETLMAQGAGHDPLAAVYIDLRNFKVVNDTYGHGVGDEVLVLIAHRLLLAVEDGDLLARIGGDKFALVVRSVTIDSARAFAHRLCDRVCRPCSINGFEIDLVASVGVSFAGPLDCDPERFLREADNAMYYAKRTGKDVVLVDDDLRQLEERHHEIEARISEALHDGGLIALYQPLVDLATGQIRGVEALARLRLGDELLTPDSFIAIAEETGQIVQVDRAILATAARQVLAWNEQFSMNLELAVNLSGVHVNRRDALVEIHTILRHSGLAAESLVVEINEGVFLTDTDAVADRLSVLRNLGVRISIDDFGTGYSSLAYLQSLPIDILKIDRSFVSRMGQSPRDDALVHAVIALAGALDLEVVAEGIEQVEQMESLANLGCQLGQGYYFDRPCDAATIENHWLSSRKPVGSTST